MPSLIRGPIHINYESFGNPAKPALILISGFSSQLIGWHAALLTALAAQGFYVIIFDNRDVGLSSYYDHLAMPNLSEAIALKHNGSRITPPYTLDAMALDVIELMDGLSIKQAHIAGMSMGGQIAQLVAIHHPERCLSLTCLETSSGNPNLPPPTQAVLDLMSNAVNQSSPTDSLEAYTEARLLTTKVYSYAGDYDEAEVRRFSELAYTRAYHPAGNTRQLLAIIAADSRSDLLKQLQMPALIIHGDSDPVFPLAHGEELASVISNSELVIFEKLGHGLPTRISADLLGLMSRLL